jgi:DNA-binding transcriptional LysR family regulator
MSNAMADSDFIGELAGFARQYPKIQLKISSNNSKQLGDALQRNEFDYVIYLQENEEQANVLRTQPVCWHAHPDFIWNRNEPIPIASFEPPCLFRKLSTNALRKAGIAWRETLTTNSFSALMATVEYGLAITARTRQAARGRTIILGADSGLPPLPDITVVFQYLQASPLAGLFAEWMANRPPYAN